MAHNKIYSNTLSTISIYICMYVYILTHSLTQSLFYYTFPHFKPIPQGKMNSLLLPSGQEKKQILLTKGNKFTCNSKGELL